MAQVRLRVLGLVVMAITLAACTSSQTVPPTTQIGIHPIPKPLPAVDLSATPVSWVPVAYGDAQISVPASWYVLYHSPPCYSGSPPGEIFVNPLPGTFACGFEGAIPKTTVSLSPATSKADERRYGHRRLINGISVFPYVVRQGSYVVPSLGIKISIGGVLGQRVLHTLTRSPRAVVLAKGPAPSVPSLWPSLSFAGVGFSVPADWPIERTQMTTGLGDICGTPGVVLFGPRVTLSTDQRLYVVPFCPVTLPRPQQPESGVQVDSGLRTEPNVTLSFSHHCLDLHGLTACPATSPAYSILVLKVTVPRRTRSVIVSIGLTGKGIVARTILYSLRAA